MLYFKLMQFNTEFELPFLEAVFQSRTDFLFFFVYMFVLKKHCRNLNHHHYLRFWETRTREMKRIRDTEAWKRWTPDPASVNLMVKGETGTTNMVMTTIIKKYKLKCMFPANCPLLFRFDKKRLDFLKTEYWFMGQNLLFCSSQSQ